MAVTTYTTQQADLQKTKRRRTVERNSRAVTIYMVLMILTVIFIAPFAWLVIISLKDTAELGAFPIQWLPKHAEWNNFIQALSVVNFGQYALNSIVLATISSVLTTLSSAFVGFGFARLKGRGKRSLFMIMLSTTMLPAILSVIPTYVLFARLGMIDTYWPWVLWGLASSPIFSFLFRQYFSSIPSELEDAAIIDGCGYGQIFWRIFLPLSKPVLATVIILTFTGVWGDYITPTLFLSQDNTTLAVAIATLYTDQHGNIISNLQAAGALLYTLPVLVLFFFAQRSFVNSIVTTGLRG